MGNMIPKPEPTGRPMEEAAHRSQGWTTDPLSPMAGLPTINHDSNIKPIEVGSGKWDFSSLGGSRSGETLDIPDDAYPWSKSHSGLPDWGLEPLKEIAPRLPGLMDSFQSSLNQLGNLPGLVDQWTNAEGRAYVNQLQPFQDYIRQPMEKLASRGVLDSTMKRDALTNLSGMLADDVRQHQDKVAVQGLQTKAAGLVDDGQTQRAWRRSCWAVCWTWGAPRTAKARTSCRVTPAS